MLGMGTWTIVPGPTGRRELDDRGSTEPRETRGEGERSGEGSSHILPCRGLEQHQETGKHAVSQVIFLTVLEYHNGSLDLLSELIIDIFHGAMTQIFALVIIHIPLLLHCVLMYK